MARVEQKIEKDAAKDAGCFAAMTVCVAACFKRIGSCLGNSWFAINPTGRLITQFLFTAALICSAVACIPALQDLYWGWILMLFACIAGVCGLFYGWEERMCGPKMPNLDKMTPGKPASKFWLMMLKPTYFLSLVCWAGIIGMSAYVLFLYIQPIARGFTSVEALNLQPPQYCDKVIGQSSRWTVPTNSSSYCDQIVSEWNKGAASTGIGVGIMLLCVMLGSCLQTGNAAVMAILFARRVRLEQELNTKRINQMEQQVVTQQAQIQNQQAQLQQLESQKQAAAAVSAQSVPPPSGAAVPLTTIAPPAGAPPAAASVTVTVPAPAPASIPPPTTFAAPPVAAAPVAAPPAPPRDQI